MTLNLSSDAPRVVPLRGLCFCVLGRRFIDMAESLCQKRALEAFRLDPTKWGGKILCSLAAISIMLPCRMFLFCEHISLQLIFYCTKAVVLFSFPGLDNVN